MRSHLRAPLALTVLALAACSDDRSAQTTAAPTSGQASAAKPTVAPAAAPKVAAAPAPQAAPASAAPAPAAAPQPTAPAAAPQPTVAVAVAAAAKPAAPALPAGIDGLVPHATAAITVDGDGADWAAIPALPAPFMHKDAGSLKLAWRDDGLYGFVDITDAAIDIDAQGPWRGDCLELWFDATGQRAEDMGDAVQVAIAPDTFAAAGDCLVVVSQGQLDANAVKRRWKARAGGYTLEFFIPAGELKPAAMASGAKLGFSYAIDDDGKAIEQFVHDKDTEEGYHNPSTWGLISLE